MFNHDYWWKLCAIIVTVTICFITIWGVLHIKPITSLESARNQFVYACTDSQTTNGWQSSGHGIPNVGSDNPKEWTCTRP